MIENIFPQAEKIAQEAAKFVTKKAPNLVFSIAALFGSTPQNINIFSNPELFSPPAIVLAASLESNTDLLIKNLSEPEVVHAEEEMVETGDPLWNPAFTGMWFPGHAEVATDNNPQITDSLIRYGQATGDYSPYYAAKAKLDTLQQDVDPTAGYCSITASARALFPEPSLKSTYYQGVLIDYKTKMGLLTALATSRAKVAFTNDPSQIIAELNQFLDGTATANFVVERFVAEDQEWFSMVNAVGSTSFRSDDFSNPQGIFSIESIQSMYFPYQPVGRDREPVNPDQSWVIPVDMDTVFAMVYGDDWVSVKQQLIDKQNRLFNIV